VGTSRDLAPPRWLVLITFSALSALLYFPLHVRYQNPDQDYPALALMEFVRGGWEPSSLQYPSALTNLLHAAYAIGLAGARLVGWNATADDLLAAWSRDPAPFRILPRFIAMTGGVVSLLAVARLTALVTDSWSGLLAAALLGTSYMFVREHHHGLLDAPASTAVIGSLYLCGRHVVRPGRGTIVAAAATATLALCFKYNAGVALLGPLLALWLGPAPPGSKWRAGGLAVLGAVLTLLATSPAVLLEPARLALHVGVLRAMMRGLRGVSTYGLGDVLRNGLGLPLLGVALWGALAALRRRELALFPLLGFTAAYGVVAWQNPLALNRYALPLAPAAAVLAAYGLHRLAPPLLRVATFAALIAFGLPSSLDYVSLIAREDTRVASARWLREHVRPDARIFLPGKLMVAGYIGPDLPRAFGLPKEMSEERRRQVEEKLSRPFPQTWRFFAPPPAYAQRPAGRERLAPLANGIVVTSEMPDEPFAQYCCSPEALRDLERYAVLLQDYPVERTPDGRTYEHDLNYVPFRGMRTLTRPGPRIRIWYVPPSGKSAEEPSPFVEGRAP